jgi:hypothetical protein
MHPVQRSRLTAHPQPCRARLYCLIFKLSPCVHLHACLLGWLQPAIALKFFSLPTLALHHAEGGPWGLPTWMITCLCHCQPHSPRSFLKLSSLYAEL